MTKSETEAYNLGYLKGISRGIDSAMRMKENADGCSGCAFEDVESWQPPCTMCKRNCTDYWRAKVVE